MKPAVTVRLILFFILPLAGSLPFVPSPAIHAEDIANSSHCDSCPGAVHYGPEEAKTILGKDGFRLILTLRENETTVKIDLDGVMNPGTRKDPDEGYELTVRGYRPIYIQSLLDGSMVQIVTDAVQAQTVGGYANWRPEIYLYPGKADPIDLKESLPVAWNKLAESHIHEWILSAQTPPNWTGSLSKRLFEAMEVFAQACLRE